MKKHRVVISGISVMASNGVSKSEFWENCLKLKTNLKKIPENWKSVWNSKSNFWFPLPDKFPGCLNSSYIEVGTKDIVQRMGLYLSKQLEIDTGLTFSNLADQFLNGVFIGTGLGGICTLERSIFIGQNEYLKTQNPDHFEKSDRFLRFTAPSIMPNSIAANIGIQNGFLGTNRTYSQACASGIVAVKEAFESIRRGEMRKAICGGIDYLYDKNGVYFHSFDVLGVLNKDIEIDQICGPFDSGRSGFIFSEGGGALLFLERLEDAEKRSAPIYCEIIDSEESFEAHSIVEIEESGIALDNMILDLLSRNNVFANNVGYINSHGTGTVLNDNVESKIYNKIFSENTIINATKSLTGHMMGTSSVVEVVVTALSLHHGETHGTNLLTDSVSSLLTPGTRTAITKEYAVKSTLAFGGHDVCMLFKKYNKRR